LPPPPDPFDQERTRDHPPRKNNDGGVAIGERSGLSRDHLEIRGNTCRVAIGGEREKPL